MTLLERFKRDIVKHRAKALVLGVLFLAMIALSIKAVFELHPQAATAAVIGSTEGAVEPVKAASSVTSDDDIRQSMQLWDRLKTVNPQGLPAVVAFTFEPSFYTLDPSRIVVSAPQQPTEIKPAPLPAPDPEKTRLLSIREQAKALTVNSTSLGTGNAPSVAIVNQKLLTVGQQILGFELVAIRAREVDFRKDGVVIPVKMADDLRGH